MFAEEKTSLRELPLEPFRYFRYGERTVNLDGCIEVEAAYYGAPPGWLGRRVHAQWDELHVRIMHPRTGQLLREHLRTRRGFHRIQEQDLPARTPLSTEALLRRAHSAGVHVGAVCEHIHRTEGELGVRRILGVLALVRRHQMNLVELDQALRKLRLSGMADVLETRLRQAHSDKMAPIDLVSALVSDELVRRQDRLFARRHKQARFRDPERSLDSSTSTSTRR